MRKIYIKKTDLLEVDLLDLINVNDIIIQDIKYTIKVIDTKRVIPGTFINITSDSEFFVNAQNPKLGTLYGLPEIINSFTTASDKFLILHQVNKSIDFYFSTQKVVTLEQKKKEEDFSFKTWVSKNGIPITYSKSGNEKQPRRIIISFPAMANARSPFSIFLMHSVLNKEKDFIVGLADRFGNNGTFLRFDDFGNDITADVIDFIQTIISKFKNNKIELLFVGMSKGATIANYYSQFFDVDTLCLSCPQTSLDLFLQDTYKYEYNNRINYISFLKKVAKSDYEISKFNCSNTRYIYSPLDYTSDNGYGEKNLIKEVVIIPTTHQEIAKNTSSQLMYCIEDQINLILQEEKIFFHNQSLGINLKWENLEFHKNENLQCFISIKTLDGFIYKLFIPVISGPQKGQLISTANININIPKKVNLKDADISYLLFKQGKNYMAKSNYNGNDLMENSIPQYTCKPFIDAIAFPSNYIDIRLSESTEGYLLTSDGVFHEKVTGRSFYRLSKILLTNFKEINLTFVMIYNETLISFPLKEILISKENQILVQ